MFEVQLHNKETKEYTLIKVPNNQLANIIDALSEKYFIEIR
jgi:hypothetical protein